MKGAGEILNILRNVEDLSKSASLRVAARC